MYTPTSQDGLGAVLYQKQKGSSRVIANASRTLTVYIRDDYDYFVVEKASEVPYQALWIEVIVPKKKNIFCCILYRQHNNPDRFLKYIDDKLEFYTSEGNPVFVLTDSNIDLLRINSCNYAHDFLLSLQSCSMLPTIDKPTCIYRDSATLIDNIFVNNLNDLVLSGNVITDLSDHFSQFCIMHSTLTKNRLLKSKITLATMRLYSTTIFYKLTGWPCSPKPAMIPTNSFLLFIIG